MTQCRVVIGDAGSIYPAALDRFSPGETDSIELDLANDIDCQGEGVTITNAVPSIHSDDDDGLMTLGTTSINGLEIVQFFSLDADTTQRNYMVTWLITTSDTRTIKRSVSIPVMATRRLNA